MGRSRANKYSGADLSGLFGLLFGGMGGTGANEGFDADAAKQMALKEQVTSSNPQFDANNNVPFKQGFRDFLSGGRGRATNDSYLAGMATLPLEQALQTKRMQDAAALNVKAAIETAKGLEPLDIAKENRVLANKAREAEDLAALQAKADENIVADKGMALGQLLANLPTKEQEALTPSNQTFSSPGDQYRYVQANLGKANLDAGFATAPSTALATKLGEDLKAAQNKLGIDNLKNNLVNLESTASNIAATNALKTKHTKDFFGTPDGERAMKFALDWANHIGVNRGETLFGPLGQIEGQSSEEVLSPNPIIDSKGVTRGFGTPTKSVVNTPASVRYTLRIDPNKVKDLPEEAPSGEADEEASLKKYPNVIKAIEPKEKEAPTPIGPDYIGGSTIDLNKIKALLNYLKKATIQGR